MTMRSRYAEIDAAILDILAERDAGKSICPSDAARRVAPDAWRPLMYAVRARAVSLAKDGRIEITRKGKPVPDLDAVKGVIRLRLPNDTGH